VLGNVLAALRRAAPRATIETVSFALYPNYEYPQNAPPRLTDYTATNIVRVTQDDLSNIGAVIDAGTRGGANQVERIRFTMKDESAAKTQALRGAALEARAKANALAGALGVQIVRILVVEESGPPPRPVFDLAFAKGAGSSTTPILPGAIDTTANVTLTVELRR
jgi:hypothetical protein